MLLKYNTKIQKSKIAVGNIKMKPSPIQILLLSFMAILVLVISGLLIFNPSFDGNIHLKSRVNPDDNSGEIHQVFVASRDIAKGEIVSVNDFQISERKQFSLDDKSVRAWITDRNWVACEDLKKGDLLLETHLSPKDNRNIQ